MSPSTLVECLLTGHRLPGEVFGSTRAVNLPGMSVTVGEMVDALERVAGPAAVQRIRWEPDAFIGRMVAGWPGGWDNSRALALGFPTDENFDAIVRKYVDEELGGRLLE
jgi:nucleoside-diphosphate-sugar epimerase